jgi:signal transduction protein with GAF and PtsI domain
MEQQALHIPHSYLCKQVKKQVPQIQHKKKMNFFIQNEFPLLEFQPKNYNKTFKQNNQKLVTQHSSSVDGMTFPPLVSYMY